MMPPSQIPLEKLAALNSEQSGGAESLMDWLCDGDHNPNGNILAYDPDSTREVTLLHAAIKRHVPELAEAVIARKDFDVNA